MLVRGLAECGDRATGEERGAGRGQVGDEPALLLELRADLRLGSAPESVVSSSSPLTAGAVAAVEQRVGALRQQARAVLPGSACAPARTSSTSLT